MKKVALIFIGLVCIGSIEAGQKCGKGIRQKIENHTTQDAATITCMQCSNNCTARDHTCIRCNKTICSSCERIFFMSADIFRSNKQNRFFIEYPCACGQYARLYAIGEDRQANITARIFNNGHHFREVYD